MGGKRREWMLTYRWHGPGEPDFDQLIAWGMGGAAGNRHDGPEWNLYFDFGDAGTQPQFKGPKAARKFLERKFRKHGLPITFVEVN